MRYALRFCNSGTSQLINTSWRNRLTRPPETHSPALRQTSTRNVFPPYSKTPLIQLQGVCFFCLNLIVKFIVSSIACEDCLLCRFGKCCFNFYSAFYFLIKNQLPFHFQRISLTIFIFYSSFSFHKDINILFYIIFYALFLHLVFTIPRKDDIIYSKQKEYAFQKEELWNNHSLFRTHIAKKQKNL